MLQSVETSWDKHWIYIRTYIQTEDSHPFGQLNELSSAFAFHVEMVVSYALPAEIYV